MSKIKSRYNNLDVIELDIESHVIKPAICGCCENLYDSASNLVCHEDLAFCPDCFDRFSRILEYYATEQIPMMIEFLSNTQVKDIHREFSEHLKDDVLPVRRPDSDEPDDSSPDCLPEGRAKDDLTKVFALFKEFNLDGDIGWDESRDSYWKRKIAEIYDIRKKCPFMKPGFYIIIKTEATPHFTFDYVGNVFKTYEIAKKAMETYIEDVPQVKDGIDILEVI